MIRTNFKAARVPVVAVAAVAVLVASMAASSNAGATAPGAAKVNPAKAIKTPAHSLKGKTGAAHATARVMGQKPGAKGAEPGSPAPASMPKSGNYAFLLKLSAASSTAAYNGARPRGAAAARAAAKAQVGAIRVAQDKVSAGLPSKSRVLYRTHAVLSGLGVVTDVRNFAALQAISGVAAVYPIAPKTLSNSSAIPLQKAPQAWTAYGDLGANSTVAILDTGVDYTHANFGGVGTVQDFTAASAQLGQPVSPNEFPGPKVIGGFDLVGDSYDPNSADPAIATPAPDPYPLDCNGHGSHVAGTVAGLGENANGSTYTGAYSTSTPFSTMRIGPGMAPAAKLYAYRIFGCDGSTDVVSEAIDMAADPNGDGDTSDHADVINMSLGSDYGSPQDGDSVTTNSAAALGINMVVASGNAGDLYDVGGSPGDASRSIAAAASADGYSQVDALNVTSPAIGPFAAERSIAFDYSTGDLAGVVAPKLTGVDPASGGVVNEDGCDPLLPADAAKVVGKIAFLEWTDNDANRRCGSVVRSGNVFAAGAIGFIFADDEESFAAGITGSPDIPGVLVSKSGGDAIRALLATSTPVTIGSTTANGFAQNFPGLDDTVAGFSSRGIRDAGNVKPDVTAVGVSVFSTGSGTGNQGLNDSGTSMATPMVAGTAALVTSMHPSWTTEQVKADIMNTAGQDLFTGNDHTGVKFAPNRVGAGRIDVKAALDNSVLAYNATDVGSVSVSFGPVAVTGPTTITKSVKVVNTGLSAASYDLTYDALTSVPGVTYTVSPSSLTVDPRSTKTFTVSFVVSNAALLTKTIDSTVDRDQAGLPREYVADASGRVLLTPTTPSLPTLRVPVYSAPRPASVMTQPTSVTMPGGNVQQVALPLTGQSVNQGTGPEAVQSTVSGFELQAVSGLAPTCSATVTDGCVTFPDERSADLKYVATTSNAPQVKSVNGDLSDDGLLYFAITTQGPWRTAASTQEFDILLDLDNDGVADAVMFNTRLGATDTMVSETVDLNTGEVLDIEGINDRLGDTDTALFDSDTMVMPVAIGTLPGVTGASHRIRYGVDSFSPYASSPIDSIGLDGEGNPTGVLTVDPIRPGLAVYGSFDEGSSSLLFQDQPGTVLTVRKDLAAYKYDKPMGALMVHFHNTTGAKAQRVALKNASRVGLSLTPNPAHYGNTITATVTVAADSGVPATGTVDLRRVGGPVFASGNVVNGRATIRFAWRAHLTYNIRAEYHGDSNYLAGNSANVALRIN